MPLRRSKQSLSFIVTVTLVILLAFCIKTVSMTEQLSLQTKKISSAPETTVLPQTKYGHLPYSEADPTQLTNVQGKRAEIQAASNFSAMAQAAHQKGIELSVISAFRTISDQQYLFDKKISRSGSAKAAAQLVAPPGYSEHHTGFAFDIGDRQNAETDLREAFEQTNAFRWLSTNAKKFGFELSFPRHNRQGVSYEPWHWRYVNSSLAQKVFLAAERFFSN
ncbi:M15 family metallopeptidase [Leptolyngbya sp. AN10]|uniref:M15 family metallopeptidase n=1 Tax=Leptolyngbya sp. AN10 TaxID=3423365 RepID=UPI003D31BB29